MGYYLKLRFIHPLGNVATTATPSDKTIKRNTLHSSHFEFNRMS